MRPVVIFDFDGVIADSVDVKTKAFEALYAGDGPEIVAAVRDYHLAHGGVSRFEKLKYYQRELVGRSHDEAVIAELANRFAAEVKHRVIAAPEIAGAVAALDALKEEADLYVASGTPELELVEIVESRGLTHYFAAVRGSPIRKTQLIQEICAHAGAPVEHAVMIGDASTDYEAALESGARFIGVDPLPGRNQFPKADAVLPDLRNLPETVRALFG